MEGIYRRVLFLNEKETTYNFLQLLFLRFQKESPNSNSLRDTGRIRNFRTSRLNRVNLGFSLVKDILETNHCRRCGRRTERFSNLSYFKLVERNQSRRIHQFQWRIKLHAAITGMSTDCPFKYIAECVLFGITFVIHIFLR